MECPEFESLILEYVESSLPGEDRLTVENHVARCASCRRFHEEQTALDRMLDGHLKPPVVGPDFRQRVLLRVAPRKTAYWPELLDLLGFSGTALAAGIALTWLLPAVTAWPAAANWAVAAASLAFSLWLAFQEENLAG